MTGAPAVILLSGGLDSATVLAIARQRGFLAHALSFDYGQTHTVELESARAVAAAGGAVRHEILKIDLRAFGGSALTGDGTVPKHTDPSGIGDGIPVTYVPARNTVFLSLALAWAEALGARDLFIGVNAIDYSGYPDCRPAFIEAFERLANVATKIGVEARPGEPAIRVHAPLIDMTKAEVIRTGLALGVDYTLTTSCYDPAADGSPCGQCDACHLRAAGFAALEASERVESRE